MQTVLLAVEHLDNALLDLLQDACVRAGAQPVQWRINDPMPAQAPAFLVAGLQQGERRIAAPLVKVVNEVAPGLPLLLVSREELVRPTVVVQDGRAVLMGPPLTQHHISERMAALLTDRSPSANEASRSGWS